MYVIASTYILCVKIDALNGEMEKISTFNTAWNLVKAQRILDVYLKCTTATTASNHWLNSRRNDEIVDHDLSGTNWKKSAHKLQK